MKAKVLGAMAAIFFTGWMAGTARADDFILWYPEGSSVESMIVIRTSPTSSTGIPLIEQDANGGFAQPFKLLKLSSTQFNWAENKTMSPVPYVPDSDPNLYYWGYDTGAIGSGDYDFNDLYIRVTMNGDGTGTLFILALTGGKPEVWSPDLQTCYAKTQDINRVPYPAAKGVELEFSPTPEPATLSLLALLALSLPKRGGLAMIRRRRGR